MAEKKRLVAEGWDSYRKNVIPATAGLTQITECKHAFYAGALILFRSFMAQGTLSGEEEATEADMQVMTDLHDELLAYADSITKLHQTRAGVPS